MEHQPRHVFTASLVIFLHDRLACLRKRIILLPHRFHKRGNGVGGIFIGRKRTNQLIDLFLRGKERIIENIIHIGIRIAVEFLIHNLRIERRQVGHVLAGDLQHALGHLPVGRGVVILIPTGHRLSGLFGILYLRPPVEHFCRGQYFDRTQESLFQILAVIVDAGQPLDRFSDFRQRVDIPFLGQRILLGPRLEGSFLLLLALLDTQFEDAARLAD